MNGEGIVIVGGGIGGLAAAVALKRIGILAQVYERAPGIQEVGAGLSLWSNALKSLRRLGLDDAVVSHGSAIEEAVTRTDRGVVLSRIDIGKLCRSAGAATVCVHRAELQQILFNSLDAGQVRLNATCVGLESNTEGVTVRFSDGRTARGALLIGADGIRSAIRDHLLGPLPPRYAGYFAYRGIARGEFPELPSGRTEFGIGRGAQIGLVHCGPERIYWFATVNAPAGTPTPDPVSLKNEAMRRFDGWFAPIPKIIAATEPTALVKNDIVDRLPAWPWGADRVTLLGDAIHPTTPNLGQGACQALEDAVVLADCIRRGGPIAASLREYELVRRDRTAQVTRRSWSLGNIFQMENPIAIALRNWLFRRRLGEHQGIKYLETLLGFDPPALQ